MSTEQPASVDALREAEQALQTAIRSGDVEKLDQLLDDRVRYTGPDGLSLTPTYWPSFREPPRGSRSLRAFSTPAPGYTPMAPGASWPPMPARSRTPDRHGPGEASRPPGHGDALTGIQARRVRAGRPRQKLPDQGRTSWRAAASTVCARRTAMVIGPTPPGTGVIRLARFRALSKSTSPTLPTL